MRLLDTTTLEVIQVNDDDVPKYATLSHTWGSEELSLQAIQAIQEDPSTDLAQAIIAREGYTKIKNAAELALSHGHAYIWIDTVTIDKTSSAELSEAINSMYRWYEESEVCYAYLSDVLIAQDDEPDSERSPFRHSRWFTRGWTLQEMIAPKNLHFYAKDWKYIGTKGQSKILQRALSDITGVNMSVLDGTVQPRDLSIATRMKWAAKRKTTRPEDVAYSLMGIFDVNMPLLYGEGKKAFLRLQEEILRQTDDQSLFAWTSDPDLESADTDDVMSGLLAISPAQFWNVGVIDRLPPLASRESVPSSFTNQGLRVQLYLRPYEPGSPNDYEAVLDCAINFGTNFYCPVLYVRRLWSDQYARIHPTKCGISLPPEDGNPDAGYRTLYVRQKPQYIIPEFMIQDSKDPNNEFELVGVYPPSRWSSHNRTLKSTHGQLTSVMGVFRVNFPTVRNLEVDVIMGLQPREQDNGRSQLSWRPWLFQRLRRSESSLKEVYDYWDQALRFPDTDMPKRLWVASTYQVKFGEDHILRSRVDIIDRLLYGRHYLYLEIGLKVELATTESIQPKKEDSIIPGSITVDPTVASQEEVLRLTTAGSVEDSESLTLEVSSPSNWTPFVRTKVRNSDEVNGWMTQFCDKATKLAHHVLAIEIKARGLRSFESLTTKPLKGIASKLLNRANTAVNHPAIEIPEGFDFNQFHGFQAIHWAMFVDNSSPEQMNFMKAVINLDSRRITATTSEGLTIAHLLAMNSNLKVSEWLIERRINNEGIDLALSAVADGVTNGLQETSMHFAAANPQLGKAVFSFLRWGSASPYVRNGLGETTFHRAAAMDNVDAMMNMYDLWKSVNYQGWSDFMDRHDRTALWHAACTGSAHAAAWLLSVGASINLADELGRTPLHIACREGRTEVVKVLLTAGADTVAPTDYINLTAAHLAALFGHVDCLSLLIRYGGSIDQMTGGGCIIKPIHLAAANGHVDCVEALLESAVPIDQYSTHYIVQKDGKCLFGALETRSIWDLASRFGHDSISDQLESRRRARREGDSTGDVQIPHAPLVDMGYLDGIPEGLSKFEI